MWTKKKNHINGLTWKEGIHLPRTHLAEVPRAPQIPQTDRVARSAKEQGVHVPEPYAVGRDRPPGERGRVGQRGYVERKVLQVGEDGGEEDHEGEEHYLNRADFERLVHRVHLDVLERGPVAAHLRELDWEH